MPNRPGPSGIRTSPPRCRGRAGPVRLRQAPPGQEPHGELGAGLLTDVSPLRSTPQFRRLFLGTVLSVIGSALTSFAVPLQVYDLTHSPFAVGAIGVAALSRRSRSACSAAPFSTPSTGASSCWRAPARPRVSPPPLAAQAFSGLAPLWLLYPLAARPVGDQRGQHPRAAHVRASLLAPGRLAAGAGPEPAQPPADHGRRAGPGRADHRGRGRPPAGLLPDRRCELRRRALRRGQACRAMPPQPGAPRPGLRAVAEGVRFIRRSQVLAGVFLADLNATVFGAAGGAVPGDQR